MTAQPLRVAVVGVGHLGRHHARLLATLPGVQLVGVVDRSEARAAEIAASANTTPFTDWRALEGKVDAVTIAVPTEGHHEVGMAFINQGVHVLIEKPLARSMAEADELVAAAAARNVKLAVGHTERFNPAVAAARPLLKRPRFIEVHRMGTLPERSLDIDVVLDLMIHDLDIVLSLVGEPVVSVEAVGVPVLTPRIDIANVRLRFEGGCIANLTASRISRERVRKIRIFQPQAYLSIDYGAQELDCWSVGRKDDGKPEIQGGKLDVQKDEPLKREMQDFVDAVRENRDPMVTGDQGRAALKLAVTVVDRMGHVR